MLLKRCLPKFSALTLVLLVACAEEPPPPAAATPEEPPPPPHIAGRAVFSGAEPAVEALPMRSVDPNCAELRDGQTNFSAVRLGEANPADERRGLADVFVFLKDAPPATDEAPEESLVVTARSCFYDPPVAGLQVGQTLVIENADPTLHQPRHSPRGGGEPLAFRFQQPFEGMRSEIRFDRAARRLEIGCASHPWMRGYLAVMEHRWFTVTDENGRFELRDPPAGDGDEWIVAAWHPTLGERELTARLGEQDLVLEFSAPGTPPPAGRIPP
ncbi:MAG: hypothetical protein AAF481_10075 [Acidobacteriota bacterium]